MTNGGAFVSSTHHWRDDEREERRALTAGVGHGVFWVSGTGTTNGSGLLLRRGDLRARRSRTPSRERSVMLPARSNICRQVLSAWPRFAGYIPRVFLLAIMVPY